MSSTSCKHDGDFVQSPFDAKRICCACLEVFLPEEFLGEAAAFLGGLK